MKTHWLAGVLVGLVFLAGLSSARAGELRHTRTYLDTLTVVFKASDVIARQLPYRTVLSDGSFVETHKARAACLGVARQGDDLLVYLPESGACYPFSDRPSAQLREALGQSAVRGLEQEKAGLLASLSEAKLLVMEALPLPRPTAAPVCICTLDEVIFLDGFETLP